MRKKPTTIIFLVVVLVVEATVVVVEVAVVVVMSASSTITSLTKSFRNSGAKIGIRVRVRIIGLKKKPTAIIFLVVALVVEATVVVGEAAVVAVEFWCFFLSFKKKEKNV